MRYSNMREEELKNTVATDFFEKFDCDRIVGSIDFAVKLNAPGMPLIFKTNTCCGRKPK